MRLLMVAGVLVGVAAVTVALFLGGRWVTRVQDRRQDRAIRRDRSLAQIEDYQQRSALEDLAKHRERINRNLDRLHDEP